MNKFLVTAAAGALLLGTGAAFAQNNPPAATQTTPPAGMQNNGAAAMQSSSPLTYQQKRFLQREARSGAFEQALSRAAEQKANDPEIKRFAQLDISEHTTLNQQAEQIARQNGETLRPTLSTRERKRLAHVTSLNGQAFDGAYLSAMSKVNEHGVAQEQTEADKAHNEPFKQYLLAAQSSDRMHASRAQELTMALNNPHSGMQANNSTGNVTTNDNGATTNAAR